MHAGDGLHHAAVTGQQAAPVDFLEFSLMGTAVIGNGHFGITGQFAGHGRAPQRLLAEIAVHEQLQLLQVAQQRLIVVEGWRHQLDQRLGIIGGDIGVAQRRANGGRMRSAGDTPGGRDAQRLLFQAAQATRAHARHPGIDQRRQTALKYAINHRPRHAFDPPDCLWYRAVTDSDE